MTGATRAFGQKVEGLFLQHPADWHVLGNWYTVGQVAEMTMATKKTARKYLEILREAGVVERFSEWGNTLRETHCYRLSTERYLSYYVGREGKN